uniref:Uncharacterized protein n=1 Tax=Schizaphis graminum TaxID=13262 RepID=A0A2S2PGU5_SCHGA
MLYWFICIIILYTIAIRNVVIHPANIFRIKIHQQMIIIYQHIVTPTQKGTNTTHVQYGACANADACADKYKMQRHNRATRGNTLQIFTGHSANIMLLLWWNGGRGRV